MTTQLESLLAEFREVGRETRLAAFPPVDLDGTIDTRIVRVVEAGERFSRLIVGTTVPVPGLDEGRAREVVDLVLDPGSWPGLLPGVWAGMKPVDPALAGRALGIDERRRYVEKFIVTNWLQLTPVLDFHRTDLLRRGGGLAQALEYRLAEGKANEQDLVRRDSGAIVAHFTGGVLQVRTTKRIRFRPPFDGPGLARFAGALGYLDASEQMVLQAIAKTFRPGSGDTDADVRG